jgi:hypothetical protein
MAVTTARVTNNWSWTVAQCPEPSAGRGTIAIFRAVKTSSYGLDRVGFELSVYTLCGIVISAPRILARAIARVWCRSNLGRDAAYVRAAALKSDVSLYCDLLHDYVEECDSGTRDNVLLEDFLEAFGTHERTALFLDLIAWRATNAPVFFAALHSRGVDLHCLVPAVAGTRTLKAHSPRFSVNMSMICLYEIITSNTYLQALLPYIQPEHTYDLSYGQRAEERLEAFINVPISPCIEEFIAGGRV